MSNWWRGGVIYQVYPRSFQDSNGDGIGDLPGITERLEHIASLGVDCVWLSPITRSPMADMGYDVSDYRDVDPLFGTLDDFDRLLEKAHALGLKIIMDQVLNHTSDQHPWFKESRRDRENAYADWYVWANPKKDGTPPNNWLSHFGGSAWEWSPSRRQYYFHNFLTQQPELNFHNEAVVEAVLDVMRFWLERGLDGFRLDTANYYFHDTRLRDDLPAKRKKGAQTPVNQYDWQVHVHSKSQPENLNFLKRVRALLDAYPGAVTVGEVGDAMRGLELMGDYTSGGDKLHMAYTFDLLGPEFSPKHIRRTVENFYAAAPGGWPCWSFSNHDVDRHVSRWSTPGSDRAALARQALALLVALKGTVGLYQGEELGLPQAVLAFEELTDPPGIRLWPEYKGRDGCRTPIPWAPGDPPNGFTTGTPWLPVKPEHAPLNVADQNADPNSVLNFYRSALAFRKAHPALIAGDIDFLRPGKPLLAFRRTAGAQRLVCIYNFSSASQSLPLAGTGTIGLAQAADWQGGRLTLGANGFAVILENSDTPLSIAGKRKASRS